MVTLAYKLTRPTSTSVWSTALALSLVSFNAGCARSLLNVEAFKPDDPEPPPATWVMPNRPAALEEQFPEVFGEQIQIEHECQEQSTLISQEESVSEEQVSKVSNQPASQVDETTATTADQPIGTQAPFVTRFSWSRVWDTLKGVGLGVGLVAGYRGIKKLRSESKQERVDRYEFLTDTSLTIAKANLHRIQEKNGLLVLDIITADRVSLRELFENTTAVKIFQSAAKKCSIEQPLIHTALEQMKLPWTLRAFGHVRFLGIPGTTKLHSWYNSALTEYYSEEAAESPAVKDFYPFRKDREVHFVIPCCDVDADKSRSIVLRILPRYQFEQFKSPEFVTKLKQDNPHYMDQIEQLEKAYAANKEYLDETPAPTPLLAKPPQHPSSNEPTINLFPWVSVHRPERVLG